MTHFSTMWRPLAAALAVFIFSLTPVVGRAAVGAAPDCRPQLAESVRLTLPRELKLNQGVIDFAMGEPKSANLITSLSNIFTELPPDRMALLGYVLRAAPSRALTAVVPFQLNPFFIEHPGLVDQSVLDNYALLLREFLNSPLTFYDLGLLAVLLKGQKRVVLRRVSAQDNQHYARLHDLVGHPDYNGVVVALLEDPIIRALLRHDLITMLGKTGAEADSVTVVFMDRTLANVRRHRVDAIDLQVIYQVLELIRSRATRFAEDEGTAEFAFHGQNILREGYLAVIRRFLDHQHLPFDLARLIDLLDHVYFETPLPIKANDIYETVVNQAKTLLNPIKMAAAPVVAERARTRALSLVAANDRHVLTEIDFFPPRSTGRNFKNPKPVASPEPKPVPAVVIREERALAPFTLFGKVPPVEDLNDKTEYEFTFERDIVKTLQRVKIGSDALDFFRSHPERYQKALLSALYMGWSDDGSGIKQVWNGPKGALCYRLKAAGSFRGILILKDKIWHLVKIVNKDDFDWTLKALKPL